MNQQTIWLKNEENMDFRFSLSLEIHFLFFDNSDLCEQPGVNFINVTRAAFAHTDPKSVKKTDNMTVFLHFQDLRT